MIRILIQEVFFVFSFANNSPYMVTRIGVTVTKKKCGWWFHTMCIFHDIWDNHPNWLIFFRGVKTTNQKCVWKTHQWRSPKMKFISQHLPTITIGWKTCTPQPGRCSTLTIVMIIIIIIIIITIITSSSHHDHQSSHWNSPPPLNNMLNGVITSTLSS